MGDVVVIGAGVAGLGCAGVLARAGLRVTVVEARARIGGRVHTIRPDGAPLPVELGAEFVHGGPPELEKLLAAAGATPVPVESTRWIGAARADATGCMGAQYCASGRTHPPPGGLARDPGCPSGGGFRVIP